MRDSGRYRIRVLCELVGVSKQAYYQYDDDLALARAAREVFALQYIRGIRSCDPGIGGTKIWNMYRGEFGCDFPIRRDRFCRIIDGYNRHHFCYLSMILDAYTEEIVGWSGGGPTLDTDCPMAALRMALKRIEGKNVNLIHHSDRGCQYASRIYVDTHVERGIQVSMTESGDPKDNA